MPEFANDELRQFRLLLLHDIEKLLDAKFKESNKSDSMDWLRSKAIRKMMNISPGTLLNLRIAGKIRYKKIMGSYYYNRTDLMKLFEDE